MAVSSGRSAAHSVVVKTPRSSFATGTAYRYACDEHADDGEVVDDV
ncbi:hypothetical protein [Halorubrum sp. FL23]